MQQDIFWMVYGIGEGHPTGTHLSKITAENEAKRLASVSPGTVSVVMEAVSALQIPKVEPLRL